MTTTSETVYRKEPFVLQDKTDNTKRIEFDLSSVPTGNTNSMKFPKDGGSIGVPPGMVMWYCVNSPPTGWLECNGAAISRTTYADLFATVGTNFGSGDGSTTFNLPDLRGKFIRSWDNGAGFDSGRSFGTYQDSQNRSHNHTTIIHLMSYQDGGSTSGYRGSDLGLGHHNRTTTSNGGTDARPRNVALLPCIKT